MQVLFQDGTVIRVLTTMYLVLNSAASITAKAKPSSPAAGIRSVNSGSEGAAGHTVEPRAGAFGGLVLGV